MPKHKLSILVLLLWLSTACGCSTLSLLYGDSTFDVSNDTPARESGWIVGQVYRLNRPATVWDNGPGRGFASFPESSNLFSAEARARPQDFGIPSKNILPEGTLLRVDKIMLDIHFESGASVFPIARCLNGAWADKEINIHLLGRLEDARKIRLHFFESLGKSEPADISYTNEVDLTPVR